MALGDVEPGVLGWLFTSARHSMRLTALRAATIVSRVQLSSGVMAVLLLAWALVAAWIGPQDTGAALAPARVLTAIAFAGNFLVFQRMHRIRDAYRALGMMLGIGAVYVVFCLLRAPSEGAQSLAWAMGSGYVLVPVFLMAGLSLFPLTVLTAGAFALSLLALQAFALAKAGAGFQVMAWAFFAASIVVAACASQLVYLAALVREGLRDTLTGGFSRQAGEMLLDAHFTMAARGDAGLALALVSLDRLQEANEKHGYLAGDALLRDAAQRLNDSLRSGDVLVRWEGDVYALIFPQAVAGHAAQIVERLMAHGLGMRPDGAPQTASIGVADRVADKAGDVWQLVDLAASRMRAAREAGGNRTIDR